jgi:hypothetical protein
VDTNVGGDVGALMLAIMLERGFDVGSRLC